jgi:superfamily II DNA or RNA helicase
MESKSTLRIVSPHGTFNPYIGQGKFLDLIVEELNSIPFKNFWAGQFPTGYGKTIIAAMIFRKLFEAGICDRMLLVVANSQQLEQAMSDFSKECLFVGLDGVECWPVENTGTPALANRRGEANVFITTVQTISAGARSPKAGGNCVAELMNHGKWFVVADEYHHYGLGRDWGNAIQAICKKAVKSIALSATPFNRVVDTVFGEPDFAWTYANALKEGAVKPFELKSAKYGCTLVDDTNSLVDLTTCDLRESEDPDKYIKKKALRYSDKYVQPVLRRAVNSLVEKRSETGKRLQMLVRAHGCYHAMSLAKTISDITDYEVDWVGSGEYGRKDFENSKILAKFVPGKNTNGTRKEPELDILVQVGMCGEGSNTVNVVEIVDLSLSTYAEPANTDRQLFGRGSRVIRDEDGNPVTFNGEPITCTVWVASDNPIAKLHGTTRFQHWIDNRPIDDLGGDDEGEGDDTETTCGGNWTINISTNIWRVKECQLLEWQEGDHFREFSREIGKVYRNFDISNPEDFEFAKNVFLETMKVKMEERTRYQELELNKSILNDKVRRLAGGMMKIMVTGKSSVPKSLYGDICKNINRQIAKTFGFYRDGITSIEQVSKVLKWLASVADQINSTKQLPIWAI